MVKRPASSEGGTTALPRARGPPVREATSSLLYGVPLPKVSHINDYKGPRFVLEVFAGKAVFTRACQRAHCNHLDPFEILTSKTHDLRNKLTQDVVRRLLLSGAIWYVHFGTPCTVWSTARHNITHFDSARAKERVGVELAIFTADMCRVCHRLGIFWSVENPASSRLWEFDPIFSLAMLHGVYRVCFHMCAYGAKHKKPTTILTNMQALLSLSRSCTKDHEHVVLRGQIKVVDDSGKSRYRSAASVAGVYPDALCARWASLLVGEAPAAARAAAVHRHDVLAFQRECRAELLAAAERGATVAKCARRGCPPVCTSDGIELAAVHQLHRNDACWLDGVVFGHHNRAEAEARRLHRKRRNEGGKGGPRSRSACKTSR